MTDRPLKRFAAELGVSVLAVRRALRDAGVRIEPHPQTLRGPAPGRGPYSAILTAEYLQRAYVERGLTLDEIGREVGCTQYPVLAAMRHHGIPRRPSGPRRTR